MYAARRKQVQAWLAEHGYEAALITPGASFFYLTGWPTQSYERLTALIIPAAGEPSLIVPALDQEAAKAAGISAIYPWRDGSNPYRIIPTLLNPGVVAVEKGILSLARYEALAAAVPGLTAVDIGPLIARLRMRKDERELAKLQAAADLLNPALEATLAQVRPGVTEAQLARFLRDQLEEHGAEGPSFDVTVLTGPNSALPHGSPGATALKEGDLLLFDFGAIYEGYCSDMTRCFSVGPWQPKAKEIYDIVLQACQAGVEAAQAGNTGAQVDQAARQVIEAAGYGEYFIHRTGHGLGLEIHEGPNAAPDETHRLEPGNVITIEPGIYLPGFGGVRIEEMVAITEAGPRVLTSFSTEARQLPFRG